MPTDDRDLLEVLKAELEFLEKGGYTSSARSPWRPSFVFQDSPTCPNYDSKQDPVCCQECILLQFVPPDSRNQKFPCRHIPLNTAGYTVDTFYRLGTQEELEEALAIWLRRTIYKLERERAEQSGEHQADKTKASVAVAVVELNAKKGARECFRTPIPNAPIPPAQPHSIGRKEESSSVSVERKLSNRTSNKLIYRQTFTTWNTSGFAAVVRRCSRWSMPRVRASSCEHSFRVFHQTRH